MCLGDIMAKKKNQKNNSKSKIKDTKKGTKTQKKSVSSTKSVEIKKEVNTPVEDAQVIISEEVKKKADKEKTINRVKRDLIYSQNDSSDEISKLVKIVLVVSSIMILFYGITVFVTRRVTAIKTAKLGKSEEKSEIQYDNILIGTMFNIEGRHFVLIYSEDDKNMEEYDSLLKSVQANDEAPKVYKANLDESFNKPYLASESDYSSDLSKFKVKGTTLIEIDGDIKSTYDNYDSIKNKLGELE